MALTKPRAILFDWDNTLVDTWPVIHEALKNTFIAYGMTPWTLQEVTQRVARSMRDSFPDLFGDKWEEAGRVYQKEYRKAQKDMLKALPGAEETLKALMDKNIFVGVVSNKTGENLRIEVPMLGWDDYFDVLVGSGDAERDKPHADPIYRVLEGSGINPSVKDVWLVGDSIIDVECTKEAGIGCIVYGDLEVTKLGSGALAVKDYGVLAQAKDHKELQLVLKNIFG